MIKESIKITTVVGNEGRMRLNWKSLYRRIPSSVQVNKKIKYVITWRRDDPSIDHDGIAYHNDDKFIVLKLELKPKEAVHTYIHELLHAISVQYDVGLTENQVLALEKALHFILKPKNVFKE